MEMKGHIPERSESFGNGAPSTKRGVVVRRLRQDGRRHFRKVFFTTVYSDSGARVTQIPQNHPALGRLLTGLWQRRPAYQSSRRPFDLRRRTTTLNSKF